MSFSLEEFLAQMEEEKKKKRQDLGLPDDAPDYLIKQEEMKRELISEYNLNQGSDWKEIWMFMQNVDKLDTARVASEVWAGAITGNRIEVRR